MNAPFAASISGGTSSAVAADRAIERYGRENVDLWFADTSWEDEDLHRFMADCMDRWGGVLHGYCDGRTPLQVASDKQIIPNQKFAPCPGELKVKPFQAWLATLERKPTILIGYGWNEDHRVKRKRAAYDADGYETDFPLLWKPVVYQPTTQVVRSWGIEPPRLYGMGFEHNNCGGRCVKQGIASWRRLLRYFPERFAEVRDWEQAQRAKGGARATYAIARDQRGATVKPMTLVEIELLGPLGANDQQEDLFSCVCSTE